jgi:hypothetical protein
MNLRMGCVVKKNSIHASIQKGQYSSSSCLSITFIESIVHILRIKVARALQQLKGLDSKSSKVLQHRTNTSNRKVCPEEETEGKFHQD